MVGLVIGQVHLQQVQALVDLGDQPESGNEAVHREDPTERGRLDVASDLVVDLLRGQHRYRLLTPMPGLPVPRLDPAPAACRVPPTLLMRYLLHHKGLSRRAALGSQTQTG